MSGVFWAEENFLQEKLGFFDISLLYQQLKTYFKMIQTSCMHVKAQTCLKHIDF